MPSGNSLRSLPSQEVRLLQLGEVVEYAVGQFAKVLLPKRYSPSQLGELVEYAVGQFAQIVCREFSEVAEVGPQSLVRLSNMPSGSSLISLNPAPPGR